MSCCYQKCSSRKKKKPLQVSNSLSSGEKNNQNKLNQETKNDEMIEKKKKSQQVDISLSSGEKNNQNKLNQETKNDGMIGFITKIHEEQNEKIDQMMKDLNIAERKDDASSKYSIDEDNDTVPEQEEEKWVELDKQLRKKRELRINHLARQKIIQDLQKITYTEKPYGGYHVTINYDEKNKKEVDCYFMSFQPTLDDFYLQNNYKTDLKEGMIGYSHKKKTRIRG